MDVLRARTKTTGIYETRFQMGQLSIQYVLDVTVVFLCICEARTYHIAYQHVRRWRPTQRTQEVDTLL